MFDEHRNIIPAVVSLGSSKFSAQVLALHAVLDLLEEIWRLEKTRYLHGFPAYIYDAVPGTVESSCPCCIMGLDLLQLEKDL